MLKLLSRISAVLLTMLTLAHAQPAQGLSNVQIIAVTSAGANYEWEFISPYQYAANIPFSGDECVIAVDLIGMQLGGYGQPPLLRVTA